MADVYPTSSTNPSEVRSAQYSSGSPAQPAAGNPWAVYTIEDAPPPPAAEVRNPANWHDLWGSFHRIETFVEDATSGDSRIRYHRADTNLPPFVVEVLATPGPTDDYGRVFVDTRERTFIIYEDGSDAVEVYSDDDGETWSSPAMAITGGSRPAACVGADGTIYRCAYVAGFVQFTRQETGEPTPIPLTSVAYDQDELPIEVEEDTIGLAEAHDASSPLTMSIIVLGDTEVSDWVSYDDAESFQRLT